MKTQVEQGDVNSRVRNRAVRPSRARMGTDDIVSSPSVPSRPDFPLVFPCCPMFSNFFQCFPMFSNVFQCVPMFSNVFQCFPMFSNVF